MSLIDLLQTLEIGKKTGIVKLQNAYQEGIVFIKNGDVLDASLDGLKPKDALFRMFNWNEGTFRVELREIDRIKTLNGSMSDLIYQGLILRDRWQKLSRYLPPLHAVVKPGPKLIDNKLSDEEKSIIRLINGKRRLVDLIELSKFGDLKTLQIVSSLFSTGSIMEAPLTEDDKNGNASLLKNNTETNETSLAELIVDFLSRKEKTADLPKLDRRRGNRRKSTDRRLRHRRWSDFTGEKNKVYLNRSELLMIREKLS